MIDARGWFLFPASSTHITISSSCFVRNRAELDWDEAFGHRMARPDLPIFSRLTEECFYHSSLTAMAELAKHGVHHRLRPQYNFPRHAGKRIVDRQFEAAEKSACASMRAGGKQPCRNRKAPRSPMKCWRPRTNSSPTARA